jgi:hypothetical protein
LKRRRPAGADEVRAVKADEAMSFYPPLGFEATSLDERPRRRVAGREMWLFLNELGRQTAGLSEGSKVRVVFE